MVMISSVAYWLYRVFLVRGIAAGREHISLKKFFQVNSNPTVSEMKASREV